MARIVWLGAMPVMALLPFLARAAECSACHARQTKSLAESGMGRSFRLAESPPAPDAAFRHTASKSRAAVQGARHLINGQGHQVRYAVGSGHTGTSFLIDRGGWLFQSPLSFYAARPDHWGVSPGYERDRVLDFSRPISEECIFCHAGSANFVKGSLNRFVNPPATGPLPCERCHGDGDAHGQAPAASNIVNPARLSAAAQRDAICEQCHLAGEARIWNPGKSWRDFVPGTTSLEDVLTVYVRSSPAGHLPVVSHAEQLAASRCLQASAGKLWCGSCHRVHGGEDHRAACLNCHRGLTAARHPAEQRDCVECHMPKRAASDGGHTAVTDHRINRKPVRPSPAAQPPTPPLSLQPWRRPSQALDARNLGLAYLAAAGRWDSPALAQQGFALLAPRQSEFSQDPEVLGALGYVLMRKNRPAEATTLLAAAVALAPRDVRLRLNLALTLAASGRTEAARRALTELLELDPQVDAARAALALLDRPR